MGKKNEEWGMGNGDGEWRMRNGECGKANGERGIFKTRNLLKRQSLKWGIFKSGNL